MPENLGFLWSVDAVQAIYNSKTLPRYLHVGGSKGNDVAALWFPPNRAKQFTSRPGKLHLWKMGESKVVEGTTRLQEPYAVASIFFQARQNSFVVANQDCTKIDLKDCEVGWSYIGFNHVGEGLSAVDFNGQYFQLAAPAKHSTWMPQVLPRVYDYESRGPSGTDYEGPPGGLCGKLALLIGMAAFSTTEELAEQAICECFKLGDWLPHNTEIGIGRYNDRGVVVKIYLDPGAEGVSPAHLRAFEKGEYGPIFKTDLELPSYPSAYALTVSPATYAYKPSGAVSSDTLPASFARKAQYTAPPAALPTAYTLDARTTTDYVEDDEEMDYSE
jgi:hypothetical protein